MKKTFVILFACLLTSGLFAQSNFSGSWKLNASKSKLNEQFSMAPSQIIIVQSGNDMSIEKHSEFQGQAFVTTDKLTLDGKECINPGFMDTQKKSVVTWDADNQILTVLSKIMMNDGNEIKITETYKIDGTNLVLNSGSVSSFGDMTETMVFDKL